MADTQVIAGARSPDKAPALQELRHLYPNRLHLVTLDVTDTVSIQVFAAETMVLIYDISCNITASLDVQSAAKQVSELPGTTGVDYLINNAAVSDPGQSRHQ